MARQDLVTELYYGGAWQPAPAYARDPVTITRGRGSESGAANPSQLGGTLDNRSGDYNPRNAASPLYGLVGRNTPIRSGLALAVESFDTASSSGWPGWTVSGAAAADFTISGGMGRHLQPLKNIVRLSYLGEDRRDVEQVTDGSVPAVVVGASAVLGHVTRWQASGDFYWLRLEFDVGGAVTAKIAKRFGGSYIELAARSGIPGLTYTAGQAYSFRSSVAGNRLAIRVWPAGTPEPAAWTLTAFDSSITAAGRYGLSSWVLGANTNTTEVRFDNYRAVDRRIVAEVAAWKPDRSVDFNPATGTRGDAWTQIEGGGILRRQNQGSAPSLSALRRTTGATGPVAYWPVEDGIAAGQAASVVPGQPPLAVAGPSPEFKQVEDYQDPFAGDTIRFGTSALADMATGAVLLADSLAGTAATATAWTVGVNAGGLDPATISKDVDLLEWTTPGGTYVRWRLRYLKASTRVQVLGYDANDVEWLFIEHIGRNIGFGPRYVSGEQIGSTITIDLYETAGATPDETFTTAGTLGAVTGITVNASRATSTAPMPVGYVAVWAAATPPAVLASAFDAYGALVYGSWASWHNEAATDRLVRVAAEAGITVQMPPVSADAVIRMGWQPTADLDTLLEQCAAADGGYLYEPRDTLALAYRPLESLYNQAPVLTLDWSAEQVAPPFTPVVDDLGVRNDVTVKRTDGSSARAVQTTGPLAAVPAEAGGVGVYDTSVEMNLADDSRLADLAWWLLHKGTVDEMRVASVAVDLLAWPGLAAAAAAVDVGDRIVVTNLPVDMGAGEVSLSVLGYTEVIGSRTRTITFTCVPASPYDVATVDGDFRIPADGTVLNAAIPNGTWGSFEMVSTAANGAWTTDPTQFPLLVRVGGEVMQVSTIGGTGLVQTAIVSARGVNGVAKSWPAGTEVDVWQPAVLAL